MRTIANSNLAGAASFDADDTRQVIHGLGENGNARFDDDSWTLCAPFFACIFANGGSELLGFVDRVWELEGNLRRGDAPDASADIKIGGIDV